MEIFDGNKLAAEVLADLKKRVGERSEKIKVVALSWKMDSGSELYSRKKQEAAQKVGIDYQILHLDLTMAVGETVNLLQNLAANLEVTGVMVQKPRRTSYEQAWEAQKQTDHLGFSEWWQTLVANIPEEKDVDGLSPAVLEKLRRGEQPKVLPATVKAVLRSLQNVDCGQKKILVIGKSGILGLPLTQYWRNLGYEVENWGRKEFERERLRDFALIVSATGRPNLILGDDLQSDVILIDVGEPKGDCEWLSCVKKASFITPVPGGIGPLTVAMLLENAVIIR